MEKSDLAEELRHHTRNFAVVTFGILRNGEAPLEQLKRIEHRCFQFLQCITALRIQMEVGDFDAKRKAERVCNQGS